MPIDLSKKLAPDQETPPPADEDDRDGEGMVVEVREDEFEDLVDIQRRQRYECCCGGC